MKAMARQRGRLRVGKDFLHARRLVGAAATRRALDHGDETHVRSSATTKLLAEFTQADSLTVPRFGAISRRLSHMMGGHVFGLSYRT
jgi:hypothetical protein